MNYISNKNKNFKYVVKCLILRKGDCGLNISGACYWDEQHDGEYHRNFDYETFAVIIYVYGLAL